jgi:hypothetical protein
MSHSASDSSMTSLPYRNPSLPVEERVADLLGRMTLEEKVGQLMLWDARSEDLSFINSYQAGSILHILGEKSAARWTWLHRIVSVFRCLSARTASTVTRDGQVRPFSRPSWRLPRAGMQNYLNRSDV